jgi:hypothetical protein
LNVTAFHFGKPVDFGGTLSPSRSIRIFELAGNLEVVYGAQSLRGKILSRRDLVLKFVNKVTYNYLCQAIEAG